ncbi:MAG: SDR family NAD(P)-dependent oxidoreductase [Lewinellaceae bacterium]|nr:SDR family NAD(P)-dependent oxidoreductase [Lewinella sp.]MCB9280721.1 SDR family NAD(P)-dependent oxidoreductase [Lewinellaceae bacterium]
MNVKVLITGASGNLGTAVVEKLMKAGFGILAVARDAEGLQGAVVAPVDLTDEKAVQEYVAAITSGGHRIGAAVLLVGGFAMGALAETDGAAIQKMIRLNFETAYHVVRALTPHFEQNGGGQFILIGSRPAFTPADGQHMVAYALSKSLVFRLSEIINETGKGKGISSAVVVPGTIDTPVNRKSMPDADFSAWVQPEIIADAIAFMLSPAGRQTRETVLKVYNQS